jgi:anti-sigma-K factor RskA
MNHDEWLERAEVYALGALDGEELNQFELHLSSGCRLCQDYLRETRETLTLLPRSLTPIEPPSTLKAKLLREIAGGATVLTRDKARPARLWWGMAAGALAAAGLLIAVGWNLFATRQELQRLQGQVAALQTLVSHQEETVQFLSDPRVVLVRLAGLPASPTATGQLLWNPVTRTGLLLTTGLPPPPADKAYELWAITGSEPIPAGVFTVDQRGRAMRRLPPLPEGKTFEKFAVTLESAGGVATPTGPMHLLGNL